jgi:hypothetical protein
LGLQIGASEPNDTERDLISLAESLVILVAWWFKESGPDILHEGAEPAKEVVAVKDWPLVKRSPPGNEKGSPPVMGILFHIREKQIPSKPGRPSRLGRDSKVGTGLEGWDGTRRLGRDSKVGTGLEGWDRTRRLGQDTKVGTGHERRDGARTSGRDTNVGTGH